VTSLTISTVPFGRAITTETESVAEAVVARVETIASVPESKREYVLLLDAPCVNLDICIGAVNLWRDMFSLVPPES